eukprot:6307849-Amphidinium_carterae.1
MQQLELQTVGSLEPNLEKEARIVQQQLYCDAGTYTLVQAFAYYTLALFVVKLGVTAPAMGASILFSAA